MDSLINLETNFTDIPSVMSSLFYEVQLLDSCIENLCVTLIVGKIYSGGFAGKLFQKLNKLIKQKYNLMGCFE